MEKAYFAGGCFWCITPIFQESKGVLSVISGYSGGMETAPSYEDVKYQRTGHRETVCVEYLPEQISYAQLLHLFLESVDPYDGGGQFIDRGHSYTLAIYYLDETQRLAASAALRALSRESGREAQIALEPFTAFYAAEEEHQDYYRKHPKEFEQELIDSGRKKG